MPTSPEFVETLADPLPNQNDASSHVAASKQKQVRKRKQAGLNLVEPNDGGTSVEEDEVGPKRSDDSISIDDQKPLSWSPSKNKSATMNNLRPTRQRHQVQPQRRVVQSSAFDGDEERGHDTDSILLQVIRYLYHILGRSLHLVKLPLSVLMSLLILLVVLTILSATIQNLFCSIPGLSLVCRLSGPQVSTSWECSLPGSSRIFPECRPAATPPDTREVKRLLHAHDELSKVQEDIVGQLSLPFFIKRTESEVREISIRVNFSDLPSRYHPVIPLHNSLAWSNERNRSILVPLFTDFWQEARVVGRNIDRFFLSVRRTHDSAMDIMRETKKRLERIQGLEEQERTQHLMSRALSLLQPAPPSPFVLVREEYLAHLNHLKDVVAKLIAENRLILTSLEGLNDKLFKMGDYIAKDKQELHDSQLRLKTGLLNKVRPKTSALQGIESSLAIVDELDPVRKQGIAVFDACLVRLQKMCADLDDLRARIVMEVVVVEEVPEIAPLESHIFMVSNGLSRMAESKVKADKTTSKFREDMHRQIDESFGRTPW